MGVEPKALSDLANKVASGRVSSLDDAMEVFDVADPSGKLRAKASGESKAGGGGEG